MNFFKNIWNSLKKGINNLFGKKPPAKLIKMEDGSMQAERVFRGGSNGILTMEQRLLKDRQQKKKEKQRKRNKIARLSRKINYRKAA